MDRRLHLSSRNGTFGDDERRRRASAKIGDVIRIGEQLSIGGLICQETRFNSNYAARSDEASCVVPT